MITKEIMFMNAIKPEGTSASEMEKLSPVFAKAIDYFVEANKIPDIIHYDSREEAMGIFTALYVRELFNKVSDKKIVVAPLTALRESRLSNSTLPRPNAYRKLYSVYDLMRDFVDGFETGYQEEGVYNEVKDNRVLFLGSSSKLMGILAGARQNPALGIPQASTFYPAFLSCFMYKKVGEKGLGWYALDDTMPEVSNDPDKYFDVYGGQKITEYWQPS